MKSQRYNRHKTERKPERKNERKPERRPERKSESFKGVRPSLYGFHAVREAWLNPVRNIPALYVTQGAAADFEDVLKEAKSKNLKRPAPLLIDKYNLEKILPQGAVHQGLALTAAPLEDITLQDLIILSSMQTHFTLLMLDQVTDPHNVGAILRSASAFQAGGVIMQRKHAPSLEGVLAKTASGAVEHIPVAYETNLSRSLEELKEAGFFVYGLDERGDKTVRDIKPGGKSVLVLGAEGEGMRRL